MENKYQIELTLEEIMVLTQALTKQLRMDKESLNDFKERKVITNALERLYNDEIEVSNNLYDRLWDLV